MAFKPMGAATINDLSTQVVFPCYVAPKYDGIRCSVREGVAYSKKMKPLPNRWLQQQAATGEYDGLDFEVVVGAPTALDVWNKSQSFVMSRDKRPEDFPKDRVRFYVFDDHTDERAIRKDRVQRAKKRCADLQYCEMVPYKVCKDALQVMEWEAKHVGDGYEGIMISSPNVMYKFGRSTVREQGLMKFKRFYDAEAEIIDCREELHNGNEATTSELGNTKRSSHAANKYGKGTLGMFVVKDLETGVIFGVGSGIDAADRKRLWEIRDTLGGKVITYKAQKTEVAGGVPRFPSFKGFRDEVEL